MAKAQTDVMIFFISRMFKTTAKIHFLVKPKMFPKKSYFRHAKNTPMSHGKNSCKALTLKTLTSLTINR
jgi:hypothetical protein